MGKKKKPGRSREREKMSHGGTTSQHWRKNRCEKGKACVYEAAYEAELCQAENLRLPGLQIRKP
jgi:hypothetical protein